ncbi:MAG: ATP-dependent helicase, partial [Opitutales bacterium]
MQSRSRTIDFHEELNDEQYAAVTAPRGPALVLAGAGSGKTRTLTYRVAWLRAQGLLPWQILLLTFTNKAAREMIERVEKLTGDEYPPSWGGTFHSLGARVLRRDGRCVGLEPSFTIMDQSDAESLFNEVAKDTEKAFFRSKDNPKPKVLLSWLSYARNTRKSISEVVEERFPDGSGVTAALASISEAYRKRKQAGQIVDYDDLLTLWLDVLRKDSEALGRYQRQFEHVLVDEYQDTNSIQSEIVDLIASEHQLMAVGDDAQCIYTWRGAEFDNILHFPDRHPGTVIYRILNNYRSTPPILSFANDILHAQASYGAGYDKELLAVRRGSLKPRIVPCADTVAQARFVIDRLIGLSGEGIPPGEVAVLYRAHYQALDLQMELSRRGIPFSITSGVRFFEQAH